MRAVILVLTLIAAPFLHAYTTGFEPPTFAPGDVNGQDGWGHIDNSPTGGEIVAVPAGSPPMFGTQALALRTRNDFLFVANRLFSPMTVPPAGEPGSTLGSTPAVNPQSHFTASLWFRTPSVPVVSERPDGRIAELNPSSKLNPTSKADRYAQVRIVNDAGGQVRVEIGWYTAGTATFQTAVVGFLEWGAWYRFDYRIHFVEGLDGTAPNDRFSLTVFDAAGAQIGTACGSTWETAWRTGSFGDGPTPRAVNGFDLWSTTGPVGTVVGHVDNVSYEAATLGEPAVAITGTINVCGGPTLLTANPAGGVPVTGYVWRNATNGVVGTDPTFNAPPGGTYTVTITNELCESATSAPFVVPPPPAGPAPVVTITGPNSVCCNQTVVLTANTTSSVTSYAWRNANGDIVGTERTYAAGPGTYVVTVTNECGSLVSAPFTVSAAAATSVPTTSEWALLLLGATLIGAAMLRMR